MSAEGKNDTTPAAAGQTPGDLLAAGIVLWRRGPDGAPRFLLLETKKGGHWSPPKGHLDGGEGFLEGARRETREECGLAPLALDPGFREEIEYLVVKKGRPRRKRVVYFLGEAEPGEVLLSDEHTAARWATLAEAWGLIAFENLFGVFERAAARIAAPAAGGGGGGAGA
jgi:bis(5'-nucleosidyl)-tetraphosphatase